MNQTHDSALPFAAKRPQPLEPVAPKTQDSPTATMLDDSPRQAAQNAPASGNQASTPMTAPLPVNPVNEPSPAATKELAPPLQPPLLAPENTQPQTAVVKPEPETTLPSAPNRPPAETGQAAGQSEAEPPEAEKTFRRDPRIKLQALVWAPDAAARFVVINNRLIREGGSVDNIVVVRIDQDDVLLAEGSDRWHEKFNIR